jgi:hypothetical protein
MAYYDLWAVLWSWRREFTVAEFRSTFPSPSPHKVLHDMARKGLLEKVGWGRYRVNSPREYVERRFSVQDAYELIRDAERGYAFTGPDAVFFWTKGGYNVDRFFAYYPIHVKVKESDLEAWMGFLEAQGMRFHVIGKPVRRTLFGTFYVLHLEDDIEFEEIDGFKVIPLKETVEFCLRNIYSYEPALEMLDEMYGLGLGVKYREIETNL